MDCRRLSVLPEMGACIVMALDLRRPEGIGNDDELKAVWLSFRRCSAYLD